MELVAIGIIALMVALGVLAVARMRSRDRARAIRHDKLAAVVSGHREMVESHAASIERLRPQIEVHRRAAAEHTRIADELEAAVARQERQAQLHEERAQAVECERERV